MWAYYTRGIGNTIVQVVMNLQLTHQHNNYHYRTSRRIYIIFNTYIYTYFIFLKQNNKQDNRGFSRNMQISYFRRAKM